MPKMTKESIIARMKEKGLKITPQRLAIIQVLIERGNLHPGTRLIYKEAKKMRRSLSLSTTYATLKEFSRYGIIKTLEFDKMENRYESNITEHINLICKGCKKIMDFKLPFEIDTNEVARKSSFRVTDRRFEYYGYCEECKKK